MAKIFYRKYKKRIDDGEISKSQAIKLAQSEVPERWREEVISLLEEINNERQNV